MSEEAKRLLKAGFIKSGAKKLFANKQGKELRKFIDGLSDADSESYANEEVIEVGKDQMAPTGYPVPAKRYRMVFESYKKSIEELYFWLVNYIRWDLGYSIDYKITDLFAAAEHSAFFGVAQQRIGLQQDKVIQFLATIGKMIKDLFQIVRELRVIDERLGYYKDSFDRGSRSRESAEVVLKGLWVDMVEGGGKNPASVYGLARELQFTTLPDLFYGVHPTGPEEVDTVVAKLDFNSKVKEVLKRKLRQFLQWKKETYAELKNRRKFTVKYLRQHYDIINMYMTWVKPYLRNIRKLQMAGPKGTRKVDLVTAFEGSMIEIEFLARAIAEGNKEYYSCIVMHFNYRTRPTLSYTQEGYQRGPIHVGEATITWRAYVWNQKQIDNYVNMRKEEDLDMIKSVDGSVAAAMDALGDDLKRYLKEEGEIFPGDEEGKEGKPKLPGILDPFTSLFKGVGDIAKSVIPAKKPEGGLTPYQAEGEKKGAKKYAMAYMWLSYKNFKKAHGMLAW